MVKKRDLLRFKKLLMAEKERLIEKSKKVISGEIMKQSGEPADEADISSSTIGQSLTIRLLSREASLVNKIEGGSFGICESCDDAIDLKRLKARPVAELCIKCKEESEKREVNAYSYSENEIIWSYSWFNGDED